MATNHFYFSSLFSVAFAIIFHKNHCKMWNVKCSTIFRISYPILCTLWTLRTYFLLDVKYLQKPHICYIHFTRFMAWQLRTFGTKTFRPTNEILKRNKCIKSIAKNHFEVCGNIRATIFHLKMFNVQCSMLKCLFSQSDSLGWIKFHSKLREFSGFSVVLACIKLFFDTWMLNASCKLQISFIHIVEPYANPWLQLLDKCWM